MSCLVKWVPLAIGVSAGPTKGQELLVRLSFLPGRVRGVATGLSQPMDDANRPQKTFTSLLASASKCLIFIRETLLSRDTEEQKKGELTKLSTDRSWKKKKKPEMNTDQKFSKVIPVSFSYPFIISFIRNSFFKKINRHLSNVSLLVIVFRLLRWAKNGAFWSAVDRRWKQKHEAKLHNYNIECKYNGSTHRAASGPKDNPCHCVGYVWVCDGAGGLRQVPDTEMLEKNE